MRQTQIAMANFLMSLQPLLPTKCTPKNSPSWDCKDAHKLMSNLKKRRLIPIISLIKIARIRTRWIVVLFKIFPSIYKECWCREFPNNNFQCILWLHLYHMELPYFSKNMFSVWFVLLMTYSSWSRVKIMAHLKCIKEHISVMLINQTDRYDKWIDLRVSRYI